MWFERVVPPDLITYKALWLQPLCAEEELPEPTFLATWTNPLCTEVAKTLAFEASTVDALCVQVEETAPPPATPVFGISNENAVCVSIP